MREQGNFRTVTEGEVYRSAQLDKDELTNYVGHYGIKSIINLRGYAGTADWYRQERAFCAAHGIDHYDLPFTAGVQPTDDQLDSLVRLFQIIKRPVLMHCMAGADRSGLAAAIWKLVIDGDPPKKAGRQLSIQYGHLPFGPTKAMDRAFESYVKRHEK